ncbi:hypothetical protein VP01_3332g1 [Puccinia sorghi]|uniref:Uncharacterized protein n=1 Tax=Puccinia sorghi TaxID=27349 RepID=A0A0L6UX72_9BASI|nr:hypothetical protein VP01_3332g1 [Puccinia sorghi]
MLNFSNQTSGSIYAMALDSEVPGIVPCATQLFTQANVNTLKDAWAGRIQVGSNFIFIDNSHITLMDNYLSKLGIQYWGPNVEEGPKSLFNSAFQIAALNTFRKIAGASGYDFMNFNCSYSFIVAQVFFGKETAWKVKRNRGIKEHCKELIMGKNLKLALVVGCPIQVCCVQQLPQMLKKSPKARTPTAMMNGIKKKNGLPFEPSHTPNAANIFFQQLDLMIFPSPFEFYNHRWLHKLPFSQQQSILDLTQVKFLSNPARSLFPKNHPENDQAKQTSYHQFSKQNLATNGKVALGVLLTWRPNLMNTMRVANGEIFMIWMNTLTQSRRCQQ